MLFKKSFYLPVMLILLLSLAACDQSDPAETVDTADETAVTSTDSAESPAEPTAEPTAEPVDTTVYTTYTNETSGLTLDYPEAWVASDSFSGVTFASSQTVLDGESLADIGENGFVNIIPGELELFNFQANQDLKPGDAVQTLIVYRSLLEKEGQRYQAVEPPSSLEVEADSSVVSVFRTEEDGEILIMLMAIVINEGQVTFITAASLEETAVEMRPIFDHMLNSVQISAPQ